MPGNPVVVWLDAERLPSQRCGGDNILLDTCSPPPPPPVARPVVTSPSVAHLHSYLRRFVAILLFRAPCKDTRVCQRAWCTGGVTLLEDEACSLCNTHSEKSRGWRVGICVMVKVTDDEKTCDAANSSSMALTRMHPTLSSVDLVGNDRDWMTSNIARVAFSDLAWSSTATSQSQFLGLSPSLRSLPISWTSVQEQKIHGVGLQIFDNVKRSLPPGHPRQLTPIPRHLPAGILPWQICARRNRIRTTDVVNMV
ncbi:hypothetical protein IW262DRAFT_1036534 [Armillaria fumosa]|nr:hypothetical protein IW262DRAFT_1036534 [Armillaria fumosa]